MEPAISQHLPQYKFLDILYNSKQTQVYRGIRLADQLPVVIKTTAQFQSLSFAEHIAFRNQFTISQNLHHPGIIEILSLEVVDSTYSLVMEDIQGIALVDFLNSPCSLTDGLRIALQLTDILHYLCQQHVIHKDIKPANIIIHPESKQVKLTDFGIASLLPKETQKLKNPNVLEGTLAYLAPEQTGRMNREVDYRADFYGLGVTLYEVLTGQLPFQSEDSMELVHCHIAKTPAPLHEINPQLPVQISNIVLKLLAKNAEDRYQSALGLKHDLELCLTQLSKQGEIEAFKVGQRDLCDRFLISSKLYGREAEVQTLLDTFDRVAQGSSELMLVAGFSGVGKTAVIKEVHKPITRQNGYFIKGKFDQLNRNIPFSAFVQAFRSLMGQLLGESDTELVCWKAKILDAVGESGQVLIKVIPELENLIGEQPAIPKLSGTAAQNRFNLIFNKFIQVFTTQEHPLVIFLDDLQWVDSASLSLLKLLIDKVETGYLLVLGAYRDNEVFPAHPLMLTLDELLKQDALIHLLTLKPLTQDAINNLVADTLLCQPEISSPLSRLVYQKTQGNPFFTTQFLQGLHSDRLITFNAKAGYWQCDLTQLQQSALTDDVVEFMVRRLMKLPEATQETLKIAACMGNRFDLNTLSLICQKNPDEVARDLWPSLQEGLVTPENETYRFFQGEVKNPQCSSVSYKYLDGHPLNNTIGQKAIEYCFLHDRIQQASYTLIHDNTRAELHWSIGNLLLEINEYRQERNISFKLVNQLNLGSDCVKSQDESLLLLDLNIGAGKQAKKSIAFKVALDYFNLALKLLPQSPWEFDYDCTLDLYLEIIETAYLNLQFDSIQTIVEEVHGHVDSLLDKIKLYEITIQYLVGENQLLTALDEGLQVLERLEVPLVDPDKITITLPAIENISMHPKMHDRHKQAALRILTAIYSAAYNANPDLLKPIIWTMAHLCTRDGHTSISPVAYAVYGVALCGSGDLETGYQSGAIALELLKISDSQEVNCKVHELLGGFISHWKEHLRMSLTLFNQGIQSGLETGDFEYVCHCAKNACAHLILLGEPLANVQQQQLQYIELGIKLKQQHIIHYAKIWHQLTLNLQGNSENPCLLLGESFNEEITIIDLENSQNYFSLYVIYLIKQMLFYMFDEVDDAIHCLALTEKYSKKAGLSSVMNVTQCFYTALTLLKDYRRRDFSANKDLNCQYLSEITHKKTQLEKWAQSAPMNHSHKYQLVEAEHQYILGNYTKSIEYYDLAIASAKANQYNQEEALANELAAKFYLDWGKDKVAAGYMQESYFCYARWGTQAKTSDLERHYPKLLQPILQRSAHSLNSLDTLASLAEPSLSAHSSIPIHPTDTSINTAFDFAAILKGAQALSESLNLDELLEQLTPMMLQNSGADRLVLLLPESNSAWHIRVNATAETTQLSSAPFVDHPDLPVQLINYVKNTHEVLAINDLETDLPIIDDYLQVHQPRSALCLPIFYQGNLNGLLYLQNQSTAGVFTPDRITILNFLCSQAAISLHHAQLYRTLEQRVDERTLALQKSQNTLQQLLVGTASVTGEEVFPTLAVQIANALQCSHVLISQIRGDKLETLAWFTNNQLQAKLTYPRAHTPCETSIQQGSHYCPCGVQEAYPLDPDLVEMGVESYLGVALKDRTGKVIGVLCLLDYETIEEMELARLVLQVFGERAAAELERQQAAQALEQLNQELEARVRDRTAQLVASEQRLQTLFNQAADAVLLLGKEGFINCNQAAVDLFRYTNKKEMIALQTHQLSPEQQPDGQRSVDKDKVMLQEAFKRGSCRFEWVHQRSQGESFWAEVTLTPIEYQEEMIFHSTIRDISDRKRAERVLRFTQYSVDHAADCILWIKPDSGIAYANHAASQMHGYSSDELMLMSVFDINPTLSAEFWEQQWQTVKEQGSFILESYHQAKDEKVFPVEIVVNYLEFEEEKYNFVRVRDISDRKAAEQTLKNINEELETRVLERTAALEQTNHALAEAKDKADSANQAKSEFLANMSHELRTPLNGILGYAQILNRSDQIPSKDRRGLEVIHQCGSHLLTLINDILDLSKIEARKLELSPQPIDLLHLLNSVVDIFQLKASEKGIELLFELKNDLPSVVEIDEKRFRQVLINLVGNALKFTEQGRVTFQVEQLECNEVQSTLRFAVIDTGVGIATDHLSRLFKAFEQVGDSQHHTEGTGLGLAISQRIVQLMGGDIQVTSQLGVGSKFSFCVMVPLADEGVLTITEPTPQSMVGYLGDRRTVLVIDDLWENRAVVQNLLTPLEFEIVEAGNGQDGLEQLRVCRPDVVILDLAMPVMDGFEFLQHLRNDSSFNAYQSIPVIISSASVGESDQQMALQQGGDAFLHKPIDAQALFQVLAEQLGLDWVFDDKAGEPDEWERASAEVVLPSRQLLQTLLTFAQMDNIHGLREHLDHLIEESDQYLAFADPILQLAKQYRTEELESLLQEYLAQEQTDGE